MGFEIPSRTQVANKFKKPSKSKEELFKVYKFWKLDANMVFIYMGRVGIPSARQ